MTDYAGMVAALPIGSKIILLFLLSTVSEQIHNFAVLVKK